MRTSGPLHGISAVPICYNGTVTENATGGRIPENLLNGGIRIDRWLWAVRIFKSRGLAAEACRKGHVQVDGRVSKPSSPVRTGDEVSVRQRYITRRFRVLALIHRRVSATIARDCAEEITPLEELEKLERIKHDPVSQVFGFREKGLGRPTKKDRRTLKRLKGQD